MSLCYFNRLTRVACWLADYPEWLQFCWDFVKPPRNDEIALQHFFFLACSSARILFYFICAACIFFLPTSPCRKFFFKVTHPPPPSPSQELNGRPLSWRLCFVGELYRFEPKYPLVLSVINRELSGIIRSKFHLFCLPDLVSRMVEFSF